MSFFSWLYAKLAGANAQPARTPAFLADYAPAAVVPAGYILFHASVHCCGFAFSDANIRSMCSAFGK